FSKHVRERRKLSNSPRPAVYRSAFDWRFGQMIQNKTLPRKSLDEFRRNWEMLCVNQNVIRQIEFLQHGNPAQKICIQQKVVRLALDNVANSNQLALVGK